MACYFAKIWKSSDLRLSVAAVLFGLIDSCSVVRSHWQLQCCSDSLTAVVFFGLIDSCNVRSHWQVSATVFTLYLTSVHFCLQVFIFWKYPLQCWCLLYLCRQTLVQQTWTAAAAYLVWCLVQVFVNVIHFSLQFQCLLPLLQCSVSCTSVF